MCTMKENAHCIISKASCLDMSHETIPAEYYANEGNIHCIVKLSYNKFGEMKKSPKEMLLNACYTFKRNCIMKVFDDNFPCAAVMIRLYSVMCFLFIITFKQLLLPSPGLLFLCFFVFCPFLNKFSDFGSSIFCLFQTLISACRTLFQVLFT